MIAMTLIITKAVIANTRCNNTLIVVNAEIRSILYPIIYKQMDRVIMKIKHNKVGKIVIKLTDNPDNSINAVRDCKKLCNDLDKEEKIVKGEQEEGVEEGRSEVVV